MQNNRTIFQSLAARSVKHFGGHRFFIQSYSGNPTDQGTGSKTGKTGRIQSKDKKGGA